MFRQQVASVLSATSSSIRPQAHHLHLWTVSAHIYGAPLAPSVAFRKFPIVRPPPYRGSWPNRANSVHTSPSIPGDKSTPDVHASQSQAPLRRRSQEQLCSQSSSGEEFIQSLAEFPKSWATNRGIVSGRFQAGRLTRYAPSCLIPRNVFSHPRPISLNRSN